MASASSHAGSSAASGAPRDEDVEYHRADFAFEELAADGARFMASAPSRTRPDAATAALEFQANARRAWNDFYVRHGHRFFKPRHYLTREFPVLLTSSHVLEVGAGNGSNVFTLLSKLPSTVHVYAADLCAAAVRSILRSPERREAHAREARLTCFLYDAATHAPPALPSSATLVEREEDMAAVKGGVLREWMIMPPAVAEARMDVTLCMFVLSAMHPDLHASAVRNMAATLRPGGSFCFRDYALYDLAMIRAPDAHILTPQLHVRGDGTLAYFFSVEEVKVLLEGAGLIVEELEYTCIKNVNRKLGVEMKRVWVHARAVKPAR